MTDGLKTIKEVTERAQNRYYKRKTRDEEGEEKAVTERGNKGEGKEPEEAERQACSGSRGPL